MIEEDTKNKLIFALILISVVGMGLFAVNQTLGYIYKAHFLKSPCNLCAQLNPDVRNCVVGKVPQYFTSEGWKNDTSTPTANLSINFSL